MWRSGWARCRMCGHREVMVALISMFRDGECSACGHFAVVYEGDWDEETDGPLETRDRLRMFRKGERWSKPKKAGRDAGTPGPPAATPGKDSFLSRGMRFGRQERPFPCRAQPPRGEAARLGHFQSHLPGQFSVPIRRPFRAWRPPQGVPLPC
jgi:hypothetical protein